MIDITKITRIVRTTSIVAGEVLLLLEVIQKTNLIPTLRKLKAKKNVAVEEGSVSPPSTYNNHHHYTKRKMRAAFQKEKDSQLRDYVLSQNKEWASSKLKEKTNTKVPSDPFE